jgi:hypothetical protein
MFGEINPLIWLLGFVAAAAVLLLLNTQFSAEARLRRRRRKNYGHTVSKGKGPMVKLAVKTEEPKD